MSPYKVTRASADPRSAARKPKSQAAALGQVFTPSPLAQQMVAGLGLEKAPLGARLLDPCVGPATFPAALVTLGLSHLSVQAHDIDPAMVAKTREWAKDYFLPIEVVEGDYLEFIPNDYFDFAIINPPYLRQEWIERKEYYRSIMKNYCGVDIPGTSNLYVYFLIKALADLKEGGRMACIVYDSWQSTRFGLWLQDYLSKRCRSIAVKSAPDLPFDRRLIDATIIFLEKGKSDKATYVQPQRSGFTASIPGVSEINQLFLTKRGLRLKQANFFMTDLRAVNQVGACPFVKKINLVSGYAIKPDHPEAVLLLTPTHSDKRTLAALQRRLADALSAPKNNVSILTWWRERPGTWAQHATAPHAPILFNYYLRRRPRHIYNPERIFSDNFYGLTPRSTEVPVYAWFAALNSTLSVIGILEQARNQGAGLAKIQLFEYRAARVVDIQSWSQQDISRMAKLGKRLTSDGDPHNIIASIDELISIVLGQRELRSDSLSEVLRDVDRRARRPKD